MSEYRSPRKSQIQDNSDDTGIIFKGQRSNCKENTTTVILLRTFATLLQESNTCILYETFRTGPVNIFSFAVLRTFSCWSQMLMNRVLVIPDG
jgi:hypothetical protein